MKKIFIINGAAGVGKDTFVEIAKYKIFIKTGLPVYNISSVDNVKIAAKILGWDGEKNEWGREFLSILKDISSKYYKGPYRYIKEQIDSKQEGIIFLHIRESNEIEYICKNYKENELKTILIKRDNIQKFNNHADKNVDNYNYDIVILNKGSIEDLVSIVEEFVEKEIL